MASWVELVVDVASRELLEDEASRVEIPVAVEHVGPWRLRASRRRLVEIVSGVRYWVENGIIDLETTLEELGMDDIGGLLPAEKKATIEHLITARSGARTRATHPSGKKPPRA